jgi:ATP-dependent RNA helicase DDX24/MAK5
MQCVEEEKILYLFYFLATQAQGRTLVFTNTIAVARRVVSILRLLKFSVHPLHAQLQQRQRLKNLDRFTAAEQEGDSPSMTGVWEAEPSSKG